VCGCGCIPSRVRVVAVKEPLSVVFVRGSLLCVVVVVPLSACKRVTYRTWTGLFFVVSIGGACGCFILLRPPRIACAFYFRYGAFPDSTIAVCVLAYLCARLEGSLLRCVERPGSFLGIIVGTFFFRGDFPNRKWSRHVCSNTLGAFGPNHSSFAHPEGLNPTSLPS